MKAIRFEKPICYGEYKIYTGITNYAPWEFSHEDYDGAPDSGDNRAGGGHSIEECIELIQELEQEDSATKERTEVTC